MITTRFVDSDLIEQFIDDVSEHDAVESAYRKGGRRVFVSVRKNDDGVPSPHHELGEIKNGEVVCDDYVVTRLSGSGHAPGDRYTHTLAVSPKCESCGERSVDHETDTGKRVCSTCFYDS